MSLLYVLDDNRDDQRGGWTCRQLWELKRDFYGKYDIIYYTISHTEASKWMVHKGDLYQTLNIAKTGIFKDIYIPVWYRMCCVAICTWMHVTSWEAHVGR